MLPNMALNSICSVLFDVLPHLSSMDHNEEIMLASIFPMRCLIYHSNKTIIAAATQANSMVKTMAPETKHKWDQ
jgi:hypothetical protein